MLSVDAPGLCPDCAGWLSGRRWMVTGLAAVPALLGGLFAGGGSALLGAVALAYLLWLLREGSYGWLDGSLFGDELETAAARWTPRHPDGQGFVKFPAGFGHAAARLALASLALLVGAGVGAVLSAGRGGVPGGDEALLGRVQGLYVALEPGGGGVDAGVGVALRVVDVKGKRALVGYQALEAAPSGPLVRASPVELFQALAGEPRVEVLIIDPGPQEQVVPRSDFARLRLTLPGWRAEWKRFEKP